ncbi:hypothetical protein Daus18300_000433 [Diaporthe australafricana]|uniref:Protein kinase domain-containing protein n=1 Tax=Diaporthe australafricana TaxID=127596 RepID=A0ABR3Y4D0_9PEZI
MSTSSSDDEPVGLASEILGKFAHSEFPPGWKEMYMPEGGLDELITRRSIIREFYGDENRKDVDESLIKFIRHSAKKVFAISLISNVESAKLRKAMKAFNASGFTDNKLPVDADDTTFPGPRLKWTAVQKKNFQDNQWRFLVPVFRENEVRLALGNRHILPFKLVGRERREGTFSDVWQVVIDKLHQETPMLMLNNGKRATAAIKVLKVAANQSESEAHHQWDNEARALEDTKGLRHSHIIEAKAIILWEGKGQYFMFQWADGGSLRDLYVSRPKVALDAGLVKEIVHQLSGLAGALNKLHNWKRHSSDDGSYRHGDLKPENILRFCDNTEIGVLKISDLGLAKHHVQATADRGPTITRYGTALYEPPEAILNTEAARSRQYDIWSMGCVVLELLIWLLYGYKELEEFNESMRKALGASSPYWVLDDTNIAARSATVHPSVVKCMNIMGKDPECVGTTAIGDLLTIVRTRLLVIPLPRDSPTFYQKHGPSPIGYRAKAEELERALKEIVDKGWDHVSESTSDILPSSAYLRNQPPHFCTFMDNLESFKVNIEFRDLPATFQNAVTITRELGVQYLWIDSICIIQGPDGDFSRQAHRMEDVFSQAYCVLAASSAKGQEDGFLHARKKRHRIRLQSSNKPAVCVSDFIDNFDEYVLQSPLNQRGWVLQERALARRTIYFTAEQTFWECGNGVQCETMTKMNK